MTRPTVHRAQQARIVALVERNAGECAAAQGE